MIQRQKKDYLQRLIEEFFTKFHQLVNNRLLDDSQAEKEVLLNAFDFFYKMLSVSQNDEAITLINKIQDESLLEQYASLLLKKYQRTDIKEGNQLIVALELIEFLEKTDQIYSWERIILKQDLLKLLDEKRV